ncbi:PREDICTED: phosphoglycerate kinase, cytosolic-like [Nicotiana attenuata]|uniref:phosphoglycerate kinase, cytosolic-like n=1 Tax=Nicotiana attenuata TaxID=49451 RepID=UPI00090520FA|nr:PREDICTED: phosphoglycerate kinase, cytosolic-like [Nicotiana attenuata]
MDLLFGRRWDISRRHMWEEKLGRYGPLVKKSVSSLKKEDLMGKKVLVKVDLDVALNDDLSIRDETRIRDALPTIKYIISCGARVILLSHRGYPIDKGEWRGSAAGKCKDSTEERWRVRKISLQIEQLASLANYYVNDCFWTSNEPHASSNGVTRYIPGVAGLLMKKELKYLFEDLASVNKPFHAIVGGSRLSTRIGVIDNLFDKGDWRSHLYFLSGRWLLCWILTCGGEHA